MACVSTPGDEIPFPQTCTNQTPQLSPVCFTICHLVQDPADPYRVYVLFGGGGIWRTDNFYAGPSGQTLPPGTTEWKPLTDGLPNNGGAISFGAQSNVLYYAIGECKTSLAAPNSSEVTSLGSTNKSMLPSHCSRLRSMWCRASNKHAFNEVVKQHYLFELSWVMTGCTYRMCDTAHQCKQCYQLCHTCPSRKERLLHCTLYWLATIGLDTIQQEQLGAAGDPNSALIPSNTAATSVSGVMVKSTDRGESWGERVINPSVSIIW